MGWKEKVILVAGVGSGLGTAVVCALGAVGATTVAVARSRKALDRLETHARSRGWTFRGRTGDMQSQGDVDSVVKSTLTEFGHLDGASLNVGHWVQGDKLIHRATDAEWFEGLRDNLDAVFRLARAAIPPMIERGTGAIVIVSASDRVRWGGSPSYCAAKGGLADLTRKLALDYRPLGIRVNAVLPGSMEHEVTTLDPPEPSGPVPLRNWEPVGAWEVARTIQYLLSDEGRWITGALVPVDGGLSTWGEEQAPPRAPG